VFSQPPGAHGVCPICRWEDDLSQLRFPRMPGSANHVSLLRAQHNFAECGAAERRNAPYARAPLEDERRDGQWRPIDPDQDNLEEPCRTADYARDYPQDTTVLYYWRASYWRRLAS